MSNSIDSLARQDEEHGTIVFLFGAGCSADCEVPVMARFMETARERKRGCSGELLDAYETTLEFRDSCGAISRVFDRWWDDIEQLMTQAQVFEIVEGIEDRRISKAIGLVIWDVCRRMRKTRACGYVNLVSTMRALSKAWQRQRGPRPVVITTNYDINLESAILDQESLNNSGLIRLCYPYVSSQQESQFISRDSLAHARSEDSCPAVEVIKLHGSVNWFREGGRVRLEDRLLEQFVKGPPTGWICQDREYSNNRTLLDPLIIAPALEKTSSEQAIQNQWRAAVQSLTRAKELVIAGYSFPETDAFMNRLLAEGMRKNTSMSHIHIVNKDCRGSWWERVEAMFAKAWWEHGVNSFVGDFVSLTILLDSCFKNQANETAPLVSALRRQINMGSYWAKLDERPRA